MEPLKILVADDEPDVLEIMAKYVAAQGYAVVPARDGEEAWQKIQSEGPDIILLDLTMPRMSGYDVLKNLRDNPPTDKRPPVIIVSAKDELDDMQKGFALEADHYLTKPCGREDVLRVIKLMAGLIPYRKTQQELEQESERV